MENQEFCQLVRKAWAQPKEKKYLIIYSLIQSINFTILTFT